MNELYTRPSDFFKDIAVGFVLDVATYTTGGLHYIPIVRRLIYVKELPLSGTRLRLPVVWKKRYLAHSHAKIYILYAPGRYKRPRHVYVGSLNFVTSTHDIVVAVHGKVATTVREHFEHLWSLAEAPLEVDTQDFDILLKANEQLPR